MKDNIEKEDEVMNAPIHHVEDTLQMKYIFMHVIILLLLFLFLCLCALHCTRGKCQKTLGKARFICTNLSTEERTTKPRSGRYSGGMRELGARSR